MKTVKDVFTNYRQGLANVYPLQEIDAITLLVLSDLLKIANAQLKAFPEIEITFQHAEQLANILSELKTGRPLQYVLGHMEFYGLPFKVDLSVLIPRPETEELVQWIINTVVNKSPVALKNIIDIGTGSGCIAIALKKHLPDVKVVAIDNSTDALSVAKQNADLNHTAIEFIAADILNFNYPDNLPQFDIIVSNPPYVTPTDKQQMHANVTNFEPHTALFVPEENPLLFYKAISDFAKEKLVTNGLLFFEINENFGKEIIEMLLAKDFQNVELRQDMSGRDRMVIAQKN